MREAAEAILIAHGGSFVIETKTELGVDGEFNYYRLRVYSPFGGSVLTDLITFGTDPDQAEIDIFEMVVARAEDAGSVVEQ